MAGVRAGGYPKREGGRVNLALVTFLLGCGVDRPVAVHTDAGDPLETDLPADTDDSDPAPDTGDTDECHYNFVYEDECCWLARPESPLPRLVLTVDVATDAWEDDVRILTDADALAGWAADAGLDATPNVDFATEVAVGAVVETRTADGHGPTRTLDGLRAGDVEGSWYAGFYQSLSDPCNDGLPGAHHATLWAAPKGPVAICHRNSWCD
jgi:hypothetical protein